jgi:hypothetical protein
MAVAVAAACWLVAPAGASAQQDPALDVSGLTSTATGALADTGSAVQSTVTTVAPVAGPAQDTVTQVAGTMARVTGPDGPVARIGTRTADAAGSVVERVTGPAAPVRGAVERLTGPAAPVAGAADRVAREARRAADETLHGATGVDEALQGATGTARGTLPDRGTTGAVAGQGSPALSERTQATLPGSADKNVSSVFTPLIPGPPIGLPGTPAGGDGAGSGAADAGAPGLPSGPEPAPGVAGGSSAAGASVSFSLGGLALLLATLSLAGPALRRRLPRRPVIGWPAAFVPLLERPG